LRKYGLKEEGRFNIQPKAYFLIILVHYKKITFNSLLSCYAIIAKDKFAFISQALGSFQALLLLIHRFLSYVYCIYLTFRGI